MFTKHNKNQSRLARARRTQATISGTTDRPRLAVFRGLKSIQAQLIDDTKSVTLAAASDKGLTGTPIEKAKQVGQAIAQKAAEKKIKSIVFDRAGYQYHGRVAALAEGAREAGLIF